MRGQENDSAGMWYCTKTTCYYIDCLKITPIAQTDDCMAGKVENVYITGSNRNPGATCELGQNYD